MGRLVLPILPPDPTWYHQQVSYTRVEIHAPAPPPVPLNCPGCGAPGSGGRCEYCGRGSVVAAQIKTGACK